MVAAHDDQDLLRVVYVFCAGPPDRRAELEVRLNPARPDVPSLAGQSFPASRFEREFHDLFGIIPAGHPFLRPPRPAPALAARLAPDATRRRADAADAHRRRAVPVRHGRRPRRVRDPGRPGPRRAHRTRPLPVLRRRRDHPEDEGPAVVRAPRHRTPLPGTRTPPPRSRSPNASPATARSRTPSPTAWPSRKRARSRSPRTRRGCGQCCSNSSGSTTTSPTSARCATTSATASPRPAP